MNANELFEIRAEVFRRMTGYIAPGKSISPLAYSGDDEARHCAWREWCARYSDAVNTTITVMRQSQQEDE